MKEKPARSNPKPKPRPLVLPVGFDDGDADNLPQHLRVRIKRWKGGK